MCVCNNDKLVDNWPSFLKVYNDLPGVLKGQGLGWIFRGEKTCDLKTSLERETEKSVYKLEAMPMLEETLLREFKRKLHHFTRNIPDDDDCLEWLTLMRHYGAPNRLLDWNYSFFVAAYFALANAGDNASVMVHALRQETFNAFKKLSCHEKRQVTAILRNLKKTATFKDEQYLKRRALFEFLQKHPKKLVHPINAYRLNERLSVQQGLFMLPGDARKGFMENLREHEGFEDNYRIIKISSKPALRKEILQNLSRMNINGAALFPDLQGFAESLKVFLATCELPDKMKKIDT